MITIAEDPITEVVVETPLEIHRLDGHEVHVGDCRVAMRQMAPESIDTIITDGPYGLGFMGKEWDTFDPGFLEGDLKSGQRKNGDPRTDIASGGFSAGRYDRAREANFKFQVAMEEYFREAFRVAKPGAMLFAFGGTRTFHRLVCGIEDAGWEIRDTMGWLHSQGFPKSHNLAGAIDRKLGHGNRGHRIAVSSRHHPDGTLEPNGELIPAYEARSEEASAWTGYGTALKPAWEPICVAMKPLDGTYAENALKWGVAGLNVDGGRIGTEEVTTQGGDKFNGAVFGKYATAEESTHIGRWPANILHDGSEEALSVFPESAGQSGAVTGREPSALTNDIFGQFGGRPASEPRGDFGSAARFFKECAYSEDELIFCNAKAILEAWNQELANTADSLSSLSNQVAFSVLDRAVSVASRGVMQLSGWTELSIPATPWLLRNLAETLTFQILSTEKNVSLGRRHEELIPNGCLVKSVKTPEQTDIITITTSPSKSNGSAESATYNFTLQNLERGAKGSEPRFKYCAKASSEERNEGLEGQTTGDGRNVPSDNAYQRGATARKNHHPTVKPLSLMRYLFRISKMPEREGYRQKVLDLFAGSGTSGVAGIWEGVDVVLCEKTPAYIPLILGRMSNAIKKKALQPELFETVPRQEKPNQAHPELF